MQGKSTRSKCGKQHDGFMHYKIFRLSMVIELDYRCTDHSVALFNLFCLQYHRTIVIREGSQSALASPPSSVSHTQQ